MTWRRFLDRRPGRAAFGVLEGAPFDPATIDGLIGWYQSDNVTGDPATAWPDLSAEGNDCNLAIGAPDVVPAELNGFPAVDFLDGTTLYTNAATGFLGDGAWTIGAVVKADAGVDNNDRAIALSDSVAGVEVASFSWNGTNGTWDLRYRTAGVGRTVVGTTIVGTGAYHLLLATGGAEGALFYVDAEAAQEDASAVDASLTPDLIYLGSSSAARFGGKVAEFLVLNRAISGSLAGSVLDYWRSRYAL